MVNHDFRAVVLGDGLEEFKSVATPVSVGNNKRFDISPAFGFHHGLKPWRLLVESRSDVVDDAHLSLLRCGVSEESAHIFGVVVRRFPEGRRRTRISLSLSLSLRVCVLVDEVMRAGKQMGKAAAGPEEGDE